MVQACLLVERPKKITSLVSCQFTAVLAVLHCDGGDAGKGGGSLIKARTPPKFAIPLLFLYDNTILIALHSVSDIYGNSTNVTRIRHRPDTL